MPIMAAYEHNDARGSARFLADVARQCFELMSVPPHRIPALKNMYRLLEAYKAHKFKGVEYEQRPESLPEARTLLPQMDMHVADLRVALEAALAHAYAGQDKDEAATKVEQALTAVAQGHGETIQRPSRDQASEFFKVFSEKLSRED